MTKMRKVVGILLALMLVMGMTSTAFAASITIDNAQAKHTYDVYQVFTGDLSSDKATLSNIKWGNGVSEAGQAEFGTAPEKADSLTNAAAASAFAKALVEKRYLAEKSGTVTMDEDGSHTFSGLAPGYYLIKDADRKIPAGDSYTQYIFKVSDDTTVAVKSSRTSVTKEVVDVNDTTGNTVLGETADYDIGDDVPFVLTATLAQNVTSYDGYKVVFHDTLSAGLEYKNNAKVTIGDKDVTENFTITENKGILTIGCDDVTVKEIGATNGSVIKVNYTAELTKSAVIGGTGNDNKVELEFSNNPNTGATGKTPEDKVVVFTYKVVVDKVSEEINPDTRKNYPLTGAQFKLEKKVNDTWVEVDRLTVNEDGTNFTFKGVDDGEYKLTETKTPDGYNTIAPIEFKIEPKQDGVLADIGNLFKANNTDGSLNGTVINEKGNILPTTGGMGTTLLYLIGGLLVVAAGATLVMRRRAND